MSKFLTLSGISTVFAEVKKYVTSTLSSYVKTTDLSGFVTSADIDGLAKTADVEKRFSDLIGGAPETLDTLNEIAEALGKDANLSATLASEIGKKAAKTDVYTKTEADAKYALATDVPQVSEITAAEITTAADAAFAA